MTPKVNRPIKWGQILSKIGLIIFGVIFMSPFIWMFFSALKPSAQVLASGANLFGTEIVWENFTKAFTIVPFGQVLINTFIYAGIGALTVVVISVLNAYAFARLEFPGRGVLFSIFIATLVLPMEVLVIPLFLGADMVGGVDSYAWIILPFAFGAFGTFMLRQFLLSLPGDYEEAARIDGAGQIKILIHVIVPLLRGPIAVVAAFAFIDYWNSFLWPLIIINSTEKAPLQLGLAMFSGQYGTAWGPLMAASSIAVLASLVIVIVMQKQLAKGINLGGFGGR